MLSLEETECPLQFEFLITVTDDCIVLPACSIEVFNAVSPNNDGSNDVFFIDGLECYPENSIEIYNRWGVLICEANGYNNTTIAFKGYSEGRTTVNKNEMVPDGTYFYILKYKDENNNWNDKSGYLYVKK